MALATARQPRSVVARSPRMAISLRLATSNLRWRNGAGLELINSVGNETEKYAGNQSEK